MKARKVREIVRVARECAEERRAGVVMVVEPGEPAGGGAVADRGRAWPADGGGGAGRAGSWWSVPFATQFEGARKLKKQEGALPPRCKPRAFGACSQCSPCSAERPARGSALLRARGFPLTPAPRRSGRESLEAGFPSQ